MKCDFKEELEALNPSQRTAVTTTDGRVLILAGAGSGKTKVLTVRMAYLMSAKGVSPKSILGLTFTNKAAAEMRHRIGLLAAPEIAKQISLCTFHSFCMQILRAEIHKLGYTSQFSLYDEKDVQRLIGLIARDLLEHEAQLPSLASTTAVINQAQNKGLASEEICNTGSKWHDEFTRSIYQRLQASLRAYNAVDFNNLLGLTVQLFENFPEVLDKYQERYRYLMIDEYQDTNPIQYKLASLLSRKYQNLCVVGDDDQSIYGWRGAEVKNILEFSHATIIKLEQNYRSTNTILKAANGVISHNQTRHQKVLWSHRGEGEPIEIFHAPAEKEEAEAVVYRIAHLREKYQLKWRDIAILYRSNALSRLFELALMNYTWKEGDQWIKGIPYEIFGGTEFYERREVRDLFAYLRVIANPLDQEALLRIINQPRRGIGEAALDAATAYNRNHQLPLWDVLKALAQGEPTVQEVASHWSQKALNSLQNFIGILESSKQRFEQDLSPALIELVEAINYKKAIDDEVKSTQMRDFKWENVQEFISSLAEFKESFHKEFHKNPTLHDFITATPLQQDWKPHQKNTSEKDQVNLLTFHSAKGLEFKACFLVGIEDHIIPHEKSLKEVGVEEERRLMYVAITRARQFLTISMARKRKKMGKEYASKPSRFLHEIPKELLKITKWDQALEI
ncbi:UvrD-helicase domain-containing protein [Parachlamydia sp. AcF125]|uniref:ATP-dependent helicase n=1 Tax=Parachlamydia sp. AcF125 TaxID=2795736 RepID=UPI001BC97255|nr:UvrD-helicase domain-containing protein [Parachlamydia sp. AcF125]MBS4168798.1 ATP-dependent DNA helicase PcrA [Parachlamydia sp. AcF125]